MEKINHLKPIKQIHGAIWEWQCDCGQIIREEKSRVQSGHKKTCGHRCPVGRELKASQHSTHGDSIRGSTNNSRYVAWQNMKSRCGGVKNKSYPDYGGRGISVCESWLYSYENFARDLGAPPANNYKQYQLDRINVNGNYEPSNCRWATREQQALNRRNTVMVKCNGIEVPAMELAKQLALKHGISIEAGWLRIRNGTDQNSRVGGKPASLAVERDDLILKQLYSGRYRISQDGRVFDLKKQWPVIPFRSGGEGYLYIPLHGVPGTFRHHRVVALAHIQNPHGHQVVHHINGNRADNRVVNLAWVSHGANARCRCQAAKDNGALDYTNLDNYADLIPTRPAKVPAYTDVPPQKAWPAIDIVCMWEKTQMQPSFSGSLLEHEPELAWQILGAPSNQAKIDDGETTINVFSPLTNISGRKPLAKISSSTDYVFLTCDICGYEGISALRLWERLKRMGGKRNPCVVCRSLAMSHPELDQLRRPNPHNGEYLHGLCIPANAHGVREYFYCRDCGREIPDSRHVKEFVARKSLPVCDFCRGRAKNFK